MKFIDRSFALTVMVFIVGAFAGAGLTVFSSDVRTLTIMLAQARMISPIRTVSHFGSIAVVLLIFLNNSIPVVLSFVYGLAILRIEWTPPLTPRRYLLFLGGYTFIAAFLAGFFSLGAPLGIGWVLGRTKTLLSLISGAQVHGPLEFAFVLVCVAEPLRMAGLTRETAALRLSKDWKLLAVALVGLLASGAIEVFLGV
jgi:hypothetical protein